MSKKETNDLKEFSVDALNEELENLENEADELAEEMEEMR